MARLDPREAASDLLKRLTVSKPPVNVEKIAKALGARVRFSPLADDMAGMIFVKDGVPTIGVNSLHHPNRQRFTIAHEIGHLVMHKDLITAEVHVDKNFPVEVPRLKRDGVAALGTDQVEIEANQFAAELLMPDELLADALDDQKFDIDDESPLEKVAKKFKVSKQALEFRIRNLSL